MNMKLVLKCLRSKELIVNGRKCEFGVSRAAYLGHIITEEGVLVDEEKIATMKTWPTLKYLMALRGFLGLTGYCRTFVKGYAQFTKVLTNQLKKDSFSWDMEAVNAFRQLKDTSKGAGSSHAGFSETVCGGD